ncbi:centromere protein W isoform X2 [Apodemus sylvaticus]|uniref:centromere protein W isoform X2 n=1 Tax=Apodemus sylvaticus TaxID=10129 RepID=UPI002243A42C|nr:centromere protein W isoform X2 [Apodemus sylvaticus]
MVWGGRPCGRSRKPCLREVGLAAKMALSTTVSRRIKRKAPRAFLKRTFKQKKPRFRLEACCDLLKSPGQMLVKENLELSKRIMYRVQQR